MPTHTVDLERLYAAVDRKRVERGISWRRLARDLDLAPSRFTSLARGGGIGLDTFGTLLAWLGADSQSFLVSLEPDAPAPHAVSPPASRPTLGERLNRRS